jgi:hypothetical protein
MFGIETVDDYLTFCTKTVGELGADQGNVLRGFAAILVLNHVPDWLQYKLDQAQRQALGIQSLQPGAPVKDFFENQNADIRLVRELANGFKHLRPTHSTDAVSGFGRGPAGIGPFDQPYLLIDLGDGLPPTERWVVGLDLCERTLNWWLRTLLPIRAPLQELSDDGK